MEVNTCTNATLNSVLYAFSISIVVHVLRIRVYTSICLPICLPICPSVCLPVCLSTYMYLQVNRAIQECDGEILSVRITVTVFHVGTISMYHAGLTLRPSHTSWCSEQHVLSPEI